MQKQAPNAGRLLLMVGFALSCIGLTLFLWISFGGSLPLSPKGYRVSVAFPEASNLAQEANVRISGIDVGKVKKLEFRKRPALLVAELEIDSRYAPIPKDAQAMLRQKTLLGETYVELTPGTASSPTVPDGGELAAGRVTGTVELDEIFRAFDQPTRRAFQRWQAALAETIADGGGSDLNEAFGNLGGFARSGGDVLEVLDRREVRLRQLVRNTGIVFGALNEGDGELRNLIVNSNDLFGTTASRNESLAEIIRIFPTFLDESRATVSRLETFSRDTDPLVRDLIPVARELTPTLRAIRLLAPGLEDLFGDLDALNSVAPSTLPDARRLLAAAPQALEALAPFLQQLNPILSFAGYQAPQLADFIGVGGAALAFSRPPRDTGEGPRHFLRQIGMINGRGLALNRVRPEYDRGNAYLAPNAHLRARAAGILESFDCAPAGGRKTEPTEGSPPCFVVPAALWGNDQFPRVGKGEAPVVAPPSGNAGTAPPGP